ncbi:MAG: IS200/IS605 family transposase [Chitinophagaceae bacterium]
MATPYDQKHTSIIALKGHNKEGMPQSLAYNYLHFITSTKHRQPFIQPDIQEKLYGYMSGICKNIESPVIQIGGMDDNIHLLTILSKKIMLIDFVEQVKKDSSKWMKLQGSQYSKFYWQGGYGMFSVNPREIDVVANYIRTQKEQHQKMKFQAEYREFLKRYQIPYDERYVWD